MSFLFFFEVEELSSPYEKTEKEKDDFGLSDLEFTLASISLDGNKEYTDKIVSQCLNLLKILNAINLHWRHVYLRVKFKKKKRIT